MTVKIALAAATFLAPATLYVNAEDGTPAAQAFKVRFRRLKKSEYQDIERQVAGGLKIPELLDQVVVGWEGLTDDAGQPVPYSTAERQAAEEEYPGLEFAMAKAWWDGGYISQQQAAAKNSAAPSSTSSGTAAPTPA